MVFFQKGIEYLAVFERKHKMFQEYIKHLVKNKFANVKILLLSIVIWCMLVIVLPICFIYSQIINFILKIKYGKLYGGLFDKRDTFFVIPDVSKCCITSVLYVKSEKKVNLLPAIRKILQEKVFDQPFDYPKLTSGKHDFGGYPFWVRNECKLDDVIQPLKVPDNVPFTEEYLNGIAAKITNDDHPKNGSILWEIHVSKRPLEDNHQDNYYRYPIITRFNHGIADGTSLVAFLIRLFGDGNSKNYSEELFKKLTNGTSNHKQVNCESRKENIKFYMTKFIQMVSFWCELIFFATGRVVQANQLRPMDVNALHGLKYEGEKNVAWVTEDQVEYIPMVKRIKNRANTKFNCVICTALVASFTDYFKRNPQPMPDAISGVVSQLLNFPALDNNKPVKLENKTTGGFVEFPCTHKCKTLVDALNQITDNIAEQASYADVVMARFFSVYLMGSIPINLLIPWMGKIAWTFMVTNVPGGSQINILDGCILEKIVPIAPNYRSMGVTVALLSYDEKFQIGVLIDKTLVPSQKEVQKIADDILYNIKMLDIETKKLCEK